MSDSVVDSFIRHFAAIEDPNARERLLASIKLRAVNLAPESAFEPDVASLRDYLAKPIIIPPSLVWPTIAVRGEITTTLGRAGKGKTTMNINRIFAWAAGRAMFPGWTDKDGQEYLKPEKPLRTMIAENEGNAGMFHQKVGLLLHQGDLDKDERELALDNIYIHGDGGYSGMKLDNDEGVSKLRASIEACPGGPPDIVFIEPFRSLWRGEENSATDMAKVVDNIVAMATDYNCAVILSHHERKGGAGEDDKMSAARGSTVLEGVVAVMENFESVKDGDYRELTWSKARYLPPPTPVRMEWDRDTGWYKWVPQTMVDDSILAALAEADDEPLTLKQLQEVTGESQYNTRQAVNKLVESKRVKRMASQSNGPGGSTGYRYRLPTGDNDSGGGLSL